MRRHEIAKSKCGLYDASFPPKTWEERNITLLNKLAEYLYRSGSSILPEWLEQKRAKVMVMPDLVVKTHPLVDLDACIQGSKGRDRKEIFDLLVEPFRLSQELRFGNTSLLYVDKMRPHAKLDMMVMQSDEKISPRYEDLSPKARHQVLADIVSFMDYCRASGLTSVCSYSIDPLTSDRKSAQSSKRYHVHFVGREQQELEQIKLRHRPLETLNKFVQRRLVDETAILLGMALADRLLGAGLDETFHVARPFQGESKYPFLKLSVKKPCTGEQVQKLSEMISMLHQTYEELYDDLRNSMFIGDAGQWKRPRSSLRQSLDTDKLGNISQDTRSAILFAMSRLSSRALDLIEAVRPGSDLRALTSHIYPNACPAYSVTLTNPSEDIIEIAFRPFLFSDTGGAGLSSIDGVVIKTRKADDDRLSDVEMTQRQSFQEGALQRMKTPRI